MPVLLDKLKGHADSVIKSPKPSFLKDYDQIPVEASVASKVIIDTYEGLGRPNDPFSENGMKLVNLIIKVWQDLYPKEYQDWFKKRTEHLNAELTISEQVSKQTGRSLASYPYAVYKMLGVVFPDVKFGERKTCVKMIRNWPMFRYVNRI